MDQMEEWHNVSDRDQALADLRRLTGIILDNLAEGSRNKLLDPKEIRLMTGTAMRTIRLYVKTLEGPTARKDGSSSQTSDEENVAQEDGTKPAGK